MATATTQSLLPKDVTQNMLDILKDYLVSNNCLGVLVSGKVGVGKSSLINSLCGAEVAEERDTVEPGTLDVVSYTINFSTPLPHKENEMTLFTAWDSPGFGDIFIDEQGMQKRLEELTYAVDKADVLLYCFKITDRIDRSDSDGIVEITKLLGPDIWTKAVFVLTFSNKLTLGRSSKFPTLLAYFEHKLQEWRRSILHTLVSRAGVSEESLGDISIVPAGYEDENPPDRDDWYTPFWMELFKKTRETGKPGLLRLTWSRLNCEEDKAPSDLNKHSTFSALPVHLFNDDEGVTNLIDVGGLAEYLPRQADSLKSLTNMPVLTAATRAGGGSSPPVHHKPRSASAKYTPVVPASQHQPSQQSQNRSSQYTQPPQRGRQIKSSVTINDAAPRLATALPVCNPQPERELQTTGQAETETNDQPPEKAKTSRLKKAVKIGAVIGSTAVVGAVVGLLIGIVGGPIGMAVGAGAGFAIGSGAGAGGVIAKAVHKFWRKKQLDKKQQTEVEKGVIN